MRRRADRTDERTPTGGRALDPRDRCPASEESGEPPSAMAGTPPLSRTLPQPSRLGPIHGALHPTSPRELPDIIREARTGKTVFADPGWPGVDVAAEAEASPGGVFPATRLRPDRGGGVRQLPGRRAQCSVVTASGPRVVRRGDHHRPGSWREAPPQAARPRCRESIAAGRVRGRTGR
jgi:hypothetical protein